MKMECDYLNGWVKNHRICQNFTRTDEPQVGNAEEEEELVSISGDWL